MMSRQIFTPYLYISQYHLLNNQHKQIISLIFFKLLQLFLFSKKLGATQKVSLQFTVSSKPQAKLGLLYSHETQKLFSDRFTIKNIQQLSVK